MAVGVGVLVEVAVGVGVLVEVAVGVGVAVAVAVGVGVLVEVAVGVGVLVEVAVGVGVLVEVAVGVGVLVGVAVEVAVGVGATGGQVVQRRKLGCLLWPQTGTKAVWERLLQQALSCGIAQGARWVVSAGGKCAAMEPGGESLGGANAGTGQNGPGAHSSCNAQAAAPVFRCPQKWSALRSVLTYC